jgi:flavodoxin
MANIKVLIVCQSIHHGNTMRIAEAMAAVLDAEIRKPPEVDHEGITECDLVGFGSGIYNRKHHTALFDLVDKLQFQESRKAFIFSTSSASTKSFHRPMRERMIEKGFDVVDEFCCKGFMDYSFTKYLFGGLNKGRPNEKDLQAAEYFAMRLKGGSLFS